MSGTCLGSLFVQDPEGIEGNCCVERKPLRETVYQLSPTDHLVFSPVPLTTQVQCNNGTYFPLKLKATTRITIPHGCSVHLTNHTIHSDFTLRIAPEAIHFEWDFNPANLPDSAKLLEGTHRIDAQLEIIRQHLSSLTNNTIGDEVFHGLMVEHLSTPNIVSVLIWVCVSILGIVLITAAALGYRSYILSSKVAVHQRQYEVALVAPSAPMNPVDRHGLRGLNF